MEDTRLASLEMALAVTILSVTACGIATAGFPAFAALTPPRAHEVPGRAPSSAGSMSASPASASPTIAQLPPSLAAYQIPESRAPRVDGRLDDPVWSEAQSGSGFLVWETARGAIPAEPTVFKIAYDDHALYFAVACHESDSSAVRAHLARRDRIDTGTDAVTLYVDPYHDGTTGYAFQITPSGVQADRSISNDGDQDSNWDAVWQSESFRDPDGWYAEARIPFSSIRYRTGESTWGLQVSRWTASRGEQDSWVVWERGASGFVSRFGRLTGLYNIPSPRQLEVVPYAVVRATDPSVPNATPADPNDPDKIDTFENIGADIRYGITPNLGLNATIQPDFGQVEADPAVLNLSPFETFYQEKRPFFIEGSQYLQSPDFVTFYSRRIGTGASTSRIRYAAKLTGKAAGNLSLGALVASTDVTQPGQAHNLLKSGEQPARYFIGRIGRQSAGGNRSVNVMQTVASRGDRDAYTTEGDFNIRSGDRAYRVRGTVLGSMISPGSGLASTYGTGGKLELRHSGAKFWQNLSGTWMTDRLDLNDVGFLSHNDILRSSLWLMHIYSPKQADGAVNYAETNLNIDLAWQYAGRTGLDIHTGAPAWSYGRGHRGIHSTNVNGIMRFRNFWTLNLGMINNLEGTQRYETRGAVRMLDGSRRSIPGGGPLIGEPHTWGGWLGFDSDSRRSLRADSKVTYYVDRARNRQFEAYGGLSWNQSNAVRHDIGGTYSYRRDDTDWLGNYENPTGGGIGGVDYVFGLVKQKTIDLTLRSSVLFSRNSSLELYAQPFLTVGHYTNPRRLLRADSYDLGPYFADGFDIADRDFRYASANLNVVYRWQYRPGSALYLVWAQSRSSYAQRGAAAMGEGFDPRLAPGALFDNEPENVFLAKITYWMPM